MEKALPILRQLDPDIEAVHAEDPNRKEKVQKMRNKDIPLLLTTTILERGVTFPNIDVAVVGRKMIFLQKVPLSKLPEEPVGARIFLMEL